MSVKSKRFQHRLAVKTYEKPKLENMVLNWKKSYDAVSGMVKDIGSQKDSRKSRKQKK